jgi:hypothetical protein
MRINRKLLQIALISSTLLVSGCSESTLKTLGEDAKKLASDAAAYGAGEAMGAALKGKIDASGNLSKIAVDEAAKNLGGLSEVVAKDSDSNGFVDDNLVQVKTAGVVVCVKILTAGTEVSAKPCW